MSNISDRKRLMKKVSDEHEVLDWIDGKKPLPLLKGTKRGMYCRHTRALNRLVAEGILKVTTEKSGHRKYERIK